MVMTDEQIVLTANQAFYRAFEKQDMEAMSALWSKGTASVCIHPGRKAVKGWEAIRTSWEQIFKATQYLEIETQIISTEINGDLAYVILTENVMQIVGRRRLQATSMATNIYSRMANQWYLIHHHGSPII
ncbi:nuclear transport factor 2 family protein [Planktothrix sp.]|uniref:nuclear transport factor 2 family protein n=2 Tax=Planktothrix sp. TaxID=3088171 RepID=UPI0038D457B3